MKHVLATAIILAFACAPAQADWQYTKWGMTRVQVAKALKGTATSGTDVQGASVLKAPYSSGKFTFTAEFSFEGEKLSGVNLLLLGGNPHELIGALNN